MKVVSLSNHVKAKHKDQEVSVDLGAQALLMSLPMQIDAAFERLIRDFDAHCESPDCPLEQTSQVLVLNDIHTLQKTVETIFMGVHLGFNKGGSFSLTSNNFYPTPPTAEEFTLLNACWVNCPLDLGTGTAKTLGRLTISLITNEEDLAVQKANYKTDLDFGDMWEDMPSVVRNLKQLKDDYGINEMRTEREEDVVYGFVLPNTYKSYWMIQADVIKNPKTIVLKDLVEEK